MPSTSIRQIHPQVWTFTQPFERNGLIKFGLRGAAIRLTNGDVFVFNAVNPKEDGTQIKTKLDEIGKVKYIACPDDKHYMFAKKYKEWYPDAQVIGVEGLPKKIKDLHFDLVYGENNKQTKLGFENEIDSVYFSKFPNKDVAFFHHQSKTLFVADLLFNLPCNEAYSLTNTHPKAGILSRIANTFFHPYSRSHYWALYFGGLFNKNEMRRDAKRVSEWDFQKIAMCHGDLIEKDAKEAWKSAYRFYL